MFTGDRSGDWLYRALHQYGFASQPDAISSDDGLVLTDCYITAACRCAPPMNKPTREEFQSCRPYLEDEFSLLSNRKIVLGLGKLGFDAVRSILGVTKDAADTKITFAHGCAFKLSDESWLLGSYHPSQQNTFTGRLTRTMFHSVFRRARTILDKG